MCGIVGLFLKDERLESELGELFEPMLIEMGERGPDSAGFAIYRNPVDEGRIKLTLFSPVDGYDWVGLTGGLSRQLDSEVTYTVSATHAAVVAAGPEAAIRSWLKSQHPEVRVMSVGTHIEIYKEKGRPADVAARFRLKQVRGTHAIGHTRMATESAVTTEHSHPFSTGMDLCLVHNGSLSNHNQLRRLLRGRGVEFDTDNDSEVAAGYLTYRLSQGDSLGDALEAALEDLDGFYTFAVGTLDGFAVLRDKFACKPAVLAETDAWVAMASEYRSIAHLPGAEHARIWEPAPATVYTWGRN